MYIRCLYISILLLLYRNKSTQQVLHVQSISKWAPSCIGPYSQAVRCGNFVMFAGQIPLDPGSMTIEESSVEGQCRLSLNHCQVWTGGSISLGKKRQFVPSFFYLFQSRSGDLTPISHHFYYKYRQCRLLP